MVNRFNLHNQRNYMVPVQVRGSSMASNRSCNSVKPLRATKNKSEGMPKWKWYRCFRQKSSRGPRGSRALGVGRLCFSRAPFHYLFCSFRRPVPPSHADVDLKVPLSRKRFAKSQAKWQPFPDVYKQQENHSIFSEEAATETSPKYLEGDVKWLTKLSCFMLVFLLSATSYAQTKSAFQDKEIAAMRLRTQNVRQIKQLGKIN